MGTCVTAYAVIVTLEFVDPNFKLCWSNGKGGKTCPIVDHRILESAHGEDKSLTIIAFHSDNAHVSELYDRLSLAGLGDTIRQTTDATTKRLALFSGIEVK